METYVLRWLLAVLLIVSSLWFGFGIGKLFRGDVLFGLFALGSGFILVLYSGFKLEPLLRK